jgi:O-methyltransferase
MATCELARLDWAVFDPQSKAAPMSLKYRFLSAICRLALRVPGVPQDLKAAFLMTGLVADGRTLLRRRRLMSLYMACTDPTLPDGSFVECGVAKAGAVSMMALAAGNRSVWGFDSFEGMPPLSEGDKGSGQYQVGWNLSGGLAEAHRTLRRFRANKPNVRLVKGWFQDTLPKHDVGQIAILRLDNDWYESTKYCLERLYDSVQPGGYIIIDDYFTFTGCKDAVDEFRAARGITAPLVTVEPDSEVYWRKE